MNIEQNNKYVELADILDDRKNPLPEDFEGRLYDVLIGVNAADAKEWYGGGVSPIISIDRAMKFVERVASDAVKKRFEPNLDFKILWAATTALELSRIYKPELIPLGMISTILRANVFEAQRDELEKAQAETASASYNGSRSFH